MVNFASEVDKNNAFDSAHPSRKCKGSLDCNDPDPIFRHKVLVIIHKLAISSWNRIPLTLCNKLHIKRISGALTNAVYYVAPPEGYHAPKLLLRIYGPHVELFINRQVELENLKRLARHNIGPYLIGEFSNGRFEQYMESTTLTCKTIRDPKLSIYVGRRLCELHNFIPLHPHEVLEMPAAWKNCLVWLPKAKAKILGREHSLAITSEFMKTLEEDFNAYYNWFVEWSRDKKDWFGLKMVFSHNDTQYGNLLKIKAKKRSIPLSQKHRTLVPVDFEYAGPNLCAFDLANYFAEWMADYHHPTHNYLMDRSRYPDFNARKLVYHAYVEQSAVINDLLEIEDASLLKTDISDELKNTFEKQIMNLEESVRAISPAANIGWALWGILQCLEEDDEWEDLSVSSQVADRPEKQLVEGSTVPPIGTSSFDYIGYSSEKFDLFYEGCAALGLNGRNRSTFSYA